MYKIKYLVTGHVFLLPENEAKALKEKYPEDYQIVEKNGKKVRDKARGKLSKKEKEINLRDIREFVVEKE